MGQQRYQYKDPIELNNVQNDQIMREDRANSDEYIDNQKLNKQGNNRDIIQDNKLLCCIPLEKGLYVFGIISLFQLIFASFYIHIIGMVLSLVNFILSILIYKVKNFQISYFNDKTKLYKIIRYIFSFLCVLVLLMLIVRIVSVQSQFPNKQFPEQCTKMDACTRVSVENQNLNKKLLPINIHTNNKNVINYVNTYIQNQSNAYLKYKNGQYVHAVFISTFWGFLDDFGVQAQCSDKNSLVQIQSESRLGKSDLGVNYKRVKAFIQSINKKKFTKEVCNNNYSDTQSQNG